MAKALKEYYTVGCCGIDCGLCPRFYTKGESVCPGCGGKKFKDKHPSCGYLTCCVTEKGLEVCSECKEYPCRRFDKERKNYDSFVTHARVFANHDFIRKNGIEGFIVQQRIRMNILKDWLKKYDDGRSKSYFCLCCALLPLDALRTAHSFIVDLGGPFDSKEKNARLKDKLRVMAAKMKLKPQLNNAAK
ncbi:DUF3795 domain-containing protein [candidate division FCPU426 bacterium]|nr:DUF3795 domain-containing protein [candidate division FCPU426 bacterium]